MATVQKRKRHSGTTTYVVRWYGPDGKEHTRGGFRTKKAAEDWAAIEVEPKRRRGIAVDAHGGKVLFRDAAAAWLASRHDLKATTRTAYADALAPTPATGTTAKRHKPLADIRIDAVFGGYPLNAITRDDISNWVARMSKAGKRPSTIRNAYFLVRQVLGQAVEDGRLPANPADYVKLPTDHNTGAGAVVDDPSLFLTVEQVRALVAATPWPYNILVHVAAWSGLRAAELAGLRVGDVLMPPKPVNPNVSAKLATLHVERTIAWVGGELATVPPKTKGSRRRVPQTAETTQLLRAYLAEHPNAEDPTAPLFPSMALTPPRPSGTRAEHEQGIEPGSRSTALRQATALADLSVTEAGSGLCSTGPSPTGMRRSTRRCSGLPYCGLTGPLPRRPTQPQPYHPNSGSTRSATPTRACASRRGDRRWRLRGSWATRK
jgi:integrase